MIKDQITLIEEMESKADIIKAISHPVRLCIIKGLMGEKELNVKNIQSCLGMPQSTISQHLYKLRVSGIVDYRKDGVLSNYYIVNEDVKRIVDILFNE